MGRRNRNLSRYKKRGKRKEPSLTQFVQDTTKLAVTGLVGASMISTVGVALKKCG